MNESEWLSSSHIESLLSFWVEQNKARPQAWPWSWFRPKPTEPRKLRLVACACCRSVGIDAVEPLFGTLIRQCEHLEGTALEAELAGLHPAIRELTAEASEKAEEVLLALDDLAFSISRLAAQGGDKEAESWIETNHIIGTPYEDLEIPKVLLAAAAAWEQRLSHNERYRQAYWARGRASLRSKACEAVEPLTSNEIDGLAAVPAIVADFGAHARLMENQVVLTPRMEDGQFEMLVEREEERLCHVLRDICGNPFRPISDPTGWMSAERPELVNMVSEICEKRTVSDLFVVARALIDAKCPIHEFVEHCGRGTHYYGCWVLDALLGKEMS